MFVGSKKIFTFAAAKIKNDMKRDEAIAKGITLSETKHSMKRRSPWHDYYQKGTYMLTLVVEGRRPLLGMIAGTTNAPAGSLDAPRVELTPLGAAIISEECQKISRFYPMVEVWKLCIMPDHLHMIVRVKQDMPKGKHLGQVVRGFKTGCSRAWWRLAFPSGNADGTGAGKTDGTEAGKTDGTEAGKANGTEAGKANGTEAGKAQRNAAPNSSAAEAARGRGASVVSASPEKAGAVRRLPLLFEPGYNDKILLREGQLGNWKAYLDDNPRRLLIKRLNPGLFTVIHDRMVAGKKCQIVGNRFLLDIPDKVAVIVHRRYIDEENLRLREEWLACGERGGVLVSAAISPKEKEVMREAMDRGYRIILLRENGFPPLYKPSGESFDACSDGQLLQISPWEFHMDRKTITRAQCLELNAMVEAIAQ